VGKPEGKRPIGRSRLNWEYNFKDGSYGNIKGFYGLDLSDSKRSFCENDNDSSSSIKCWEALE
jgi:hypothetical protein